LKEAAGAAARYLRRLTELVPASGVPRLDSYNGVAVRIFRSNNAGNIHHIIDPAINQVAASSRAVPTRTIWQFTWRTLFASEQDRTVDVFDTKTLHLVQQIALSERPNKIVVNNKHKKIVNKKHKKIYAAIVNGTDRVAGPGFQPTPGKSLASVVDVIDIASQLARWFAAGRLVRARRREQCAKGPKNRAWLCLLRQWRNAGLNKQWNDWSSGF
jgi:hypothetical protein